MDKMRERTTAGLACLLAGCLIASSAVAQDWISAGRSWTGSYGWPGTTERAHRLQLMLNQRRLESGAFNSGAVYNTTNNITYDSSVGNINVEADGGATVEIDNRTAEGSGTNSYVVGAINNTNNDITIDGDGNNIDIAPYADSEGCQNGSIQTTANQVMGGFDISAGGSGATASSTNSTSSSGGNLNCN